MELMDSRNLHRGDRVRVRQPGQFNGRNRDADSFVTGTLCGIYQGVPRTFMVEIAGRQVAVADGNIEAA
jgi:hypothetical protein